MIATSDIDTLRAYAEDKRATTNPEVTDALDRTVQFLVGLQDESKREAATLDAVDELIKMTDQAVEDLPDGDAQQLVAVGVGILGAASHVATSIAAAVDRLTGIEAAVKRMSAPVGQVVREATPQQRARLREAEADYIVGMGGLTTKSPSGLVGERFADLLAAGKVPRGVLVLFSWRDA